MKKLFCVTLAVFIFVLFGCSQQKQAVSDTDTNNRLFADPKELTALYFEYLTAENAAGIADLYSFQHNKTVYPDTDNYTQAITRKDPIFVTYKGYQLEKLDITDYSLSEEMYSENNNHAAFWGYENAESYCELDCCAYLIHPSDGDSAIVPFSFVLVKIDGVWYFIN